MTRIGELLAPSKKTSYPPSYIHPTKDQLMQTIMTNVIKNTYYQNQKSQLNESVHLHKSMVTKDPLFHYKAIKFGREVGNMYLQPVIGLAAGAKVYSAEAQLALLKTMTPKRVLEYVEILKSGVFGHGFGRRQKEIVAKYLATVRSPGYYSLKYTKEIVDLLKLSHPTREVLGDNFKIYGYALGHEEAVTTEQGEFELLKELSGYKFAEVLKTSNVPWDVTTSFDQSPEAWRARAHRMPTGALVGNLATLARHNAVDAEYIRSRLTPAAIEKARLFPQNLLKAHSKVPTELKRVIEEAYVNAYANRYPFFENKKVAIVLDVSGSMGSFLQQTKESMALASMIMLSARDFDMYYFDTRLYKERTEVLGPQRSRYGRTYDVDRLPKFKEMSQAQIAQMVLNMNFLNGGGTDTGLILRYLTSQWIDYDLVIMITDEQQNAGAPAYGQWNKYHERFPHSRFFVLNVAPYKSHMIPAHDDTAICLPAKSPTVLECIKYYGVKLTDVVDASTV